jgi:hypothetical protein
MGETPKRANWIGAPEFFNLNFACQAIVAAFGYSCYLVGSSMERKDFRDVDVRCMLDDGEYDRMFPPTFAGEQRIRNQNLDAAWCLLNSAISCWLSERTGLKIDFQFQRQSDANEEHKGKRNALGMFIDTRPSEL